jgi:excisionase family DNA binding protein
MADRLAYSIAEACAVAGIRRTTLYKEIRSGDLRAVKIGGRTVILADDLRRWLNRRPPITRIEARVRERPLGSP